MTIPWPYPKGQGRESSDDPLALIKGSGKGKASGVNPRAFLKGREGHDNNQALSKWEGKGRTVTISLLILNEKTKGGQSVTTLLPLPNKFVYMK